MAKLVGDPFEVGGTLYAVTDVGPKVYQFKKFEYAIVKMNDDGWSDPLKQFTPSDMPDGKDGDPVEWGKDWVTKYLA